MKKHAFSLTAALFLTYFSLHAQKENANKLLEPNYWKEHPTLAQVKLSVQQGNDPKAKTPMADAVSTAINNGADNDVIIYLLEQNGNDVNRLGHEDLTYMHAAAVTGNVEIMKYLLSKGAKVDVVTHFGMSPIQFAANSGQLNTEVYELLFKSGIDPKAKYQDGANLLLYAIPADKDLKLAEYFSTKGMSLQDKDAKGRTAFDYAAKLGDVALLKKLIAHKVTATNAALIFAAQGTRRQTNTIDVYEYLINEVKLDPKTKNENGETVLSIIAKKQDQLPIINLFLSKGLDINQTDNDGNTAFMNAASSKEIETVKALLPKVKDINAVNKDGESALTKAVKSSNAEVIDLLISNGANINITDKEGNNLAYVLVQSHRNRPFNKGKDDLEERLTILQKHGLNIAKAQSNGNTLYHVAATKNDLVALKSLQNFGIDINAKNAEGLTALHKSALVAKNDETMKYLLEIGADKSLKTEMDETAYDLAKENDYLAQNKISIDFLK